ncbi:ATPase assembly factor ATP10, partial [Catenaria anguillulae PL171]
GKLSIAPTTLTDAAISKRFPALTVTPLSETSTEIPMLPRLQGQVTLVTLACSTYGDNQTKSFEMAFRQAYPHVPVYQISMADTPIKAWILKLNLRYTRAKVPKEQWDKYFVATKLPVDQALEELKVTNKYVGWVFLVDHRGRVRWRANGVATEQE